METPKNLWVLICEDGELYPADFATCHDRCMVEGLLDQIGHSGAECDGDCDTHRIVKYIPDPASLVPPEMLRKTNILPPPEFLDDLKKAPVNPEGGNLQVIDPKPDPEEGS